MLKCKGNKVWPVTCFMSRFYSPTEHASFTLPRKEKVEMFYCTACEDKKHFSVLVSVSMALTYETRPAIYIHPRTGLVTFSLR